MTRYKQEHPVNDEGWSEWIQPVMVGYRLCCCDCGLVHEMEFEALRKGADNSDGSWRAAQLDRERYRVQFRVRRLNRATGQVRRRKQRGIET